MQTMKWGDVGLEHDGRTVTVSAASTPEDPEHRAGPFTGTIDMPSADAYPVLHVGNTVHYFADWYDVKVLD